MKFKIFSLILISLIFFGFSSNNDLKYDYIITIKTDLGDIKAILFDDTPIHKNNFIELAEAGKFDGSEFHRVINGFMIQGGLIERSDEFKNSSFENRTLPSEILPQHSHVRGAISAARVENPEKRSDKSQFFIVQNCLGAHNLDNLYTVFGQVIVGMDIVDKIANVEVENTQPKSKVEFEVKIDKVKREEIIKYYGDVYSKYKIK
jgi:peptidyl-prolyl cis-trans isomerase B (cyclophilin B)